MDVAMLAVEVLDSGVDIAVLTVSFLSIFVFLACFVLIMLKPGTAQSVTDFTLVFLIGSNTNCHEIPGNTTWTELS